MTESYAYFSWGDIVYRMPGEEARYRYSVSGIMRWVPAVESIDRILSHGKPLSELETLVRGLDLEDFDGTL